MKNIVNAKDIQDLLRIDPVFAFINSNYGQPPDWSRPRGFTSLCGIILEQHISLASAHAHFLKLSSYIADVTPANILRLSDDEMRICQISRQKAKYLRALSAAVLDGLLNLEQVSELDEEEAREQLKNIKGIGDWTVDIYFMFCLQSKDIFPLGDRAIVKTVEELWGTETKSGVSRLSENWKPYRSLAAYYLWHYYLASRALSAVASAKAVRS